MEPGVYLPDRGGVRIEDTLVVNVASGPHRPSTPELLTRFPKELADPLEGAPTVASTADFKNGLVLQIDGQLWQITEFQHVKPGKGPAFVRTKLKNVLSGKVVDKTFNAGVKVETATVDRRDATYLYRDGTDFVFMDSEDYEQHPLPEALVGDAANFLLESMPVQIAFHEGAALYLELPVTVELVVSHTEPGLQGDRSQRRHQARDAGDRRRDPGSAVHQHRRQAEGRYARRKLPGPRECLTASRRARSRPASGAQAGRRPALRGRGPRADAPPRWPTAAPHWPKRSPMSPR